MRFPTNYITIPQGFSSKHHGLDLGWYSPLHHNQPIYSAWDGEVIYIEYQKTGGNVIHVRHRINGEYYVSEYGHLKDKSIQVIVGQQVKTAQQLANMGDTGYVYNKKKKKYVRVDEHLHYGLYKGKTINYEDPSGWVNPLDYLEVYNNQVVGSKAQKEYGNKIKYHRETYDKGIYVTLYNMNIRKAPNGVKVKVKECTEAMKKALTSKKPNANAVIKKGINFTCLDIVERNGYWAKNYSGYICIKDNKNEYCRKV